jgi:hypothetical protein
VAISPIRVTRNMTDPAVTHSDKVIDSDFCPTFVLHHDRADYAI